MQYNKWQDSRKYRLVVTGARFLGVLLIATMVSIFALVVAGYNGLYIQALAGIILPLCGSFVSVLGFYFGANVAQKFTGKRGGDEFPNDR